MKKRLASILLTLPLGAAHVMAAQDIPEQWAFSQQVRIEKAGLVRAKLPLELLTRTVRDNMVQESVAGSGSIFRTTAEGGAPAEKLRFRMSGRLPSDEAVLRIINADNRPIAISRVEIEVAPAFLVFHAEDAGAYQVMSGNKKAQAGRYDAAALRTRMIEPVFQGGQWGPLVENRAHKPLAAYSQAAERGTELDVSDYPYRKKLLLGGSGIHRLELDLQTLAHDGNRLHDLRIIREGSQVPYVLDNTGVSRSFEPLLEPGGEEGTLSRWNLTLPYAPLPLNQIRCETDKSLFQRTARLLGEFKDSRGEKSWRQLGQAQWTRLTGESRHDFTLPVEGIVPSEKLRIEMDNADNLPVRITSCRAYYRGPRLVFKASSGGDTFLYYGSKDLGPPHYDLRLVSESLMSETPLEVGLNTEELLKAEPWWEAPRPTGILKYLFWLVLAAVVGGLIVVIAKLLPEMPDRKKGPF